MNSFKDKEILNILDYKYQVQRWKLAVPWGIINLILAITLYYDLNTGSIGLSAFLTSISPVLWYFECTLLVVFSVNVMFDFGNYFWISLFSTQWKLSPQLRTLLGIQPADTFCTDIVPGNNSKADSSTRSETPLRGSASDLSNFFVSSTRQQSSRIWTSSPSNSVLLSPFGTSFSDDSQMLSTSASSWTYVDGCDVSARLKQSLHSSSSFPMSAEEIVTDEITFKKYLNEMEKTESQIIGAADLSNTSACSSGRWSANATFGSDVSPVVSKFHYQLSTRGPQSSTLRSKDPDSSPSSQEVWSRVGVQSETVFGWTENLRKWLGKTILSRLVSEIDKVNESLRWQGISEVQIGEVGLSVLRQRAKGPQFASLYAVLQYLEVTSNQEYLVHRLKELEKGGCMSEFRWNSGGTFKGKPWGDHLPTDSAIVFSLFCVYLDSRLPLHSGFPDGKPFTNQYFCKAPDQPGMSIYSFVPVASCEHKENYFCCMATTNFERTGSWWWPKSSTNPPHFKLLVRSEVWELQKGRNNLFHVILLFLYLLKTKENGMLNRVNLGPSGLNILWIIE